MGWFKGDFGGPDELIKGIGPSPAESELDFSCPPDEEASVDEGASTEELVFVLCRFRNHFLFEESSSSTTGASSEEEVGATGAAAFDGPGTGMGATLATVVG